MLGLKPSNYFYLQLSHQGQVTTANELSTTTIRSRLAELEAMHGQSDSENTQLRRDKMLLVDHVANLQRQVSTISDSAAWLKFTHYVVVDQELVLSRVHEID